MFMLYIVDGKIVVVSDVGISLEMIHLKINSNPTLFDGWVKCFPWIIEDALSLQYFHYKNKPLRKNCPVICKYHHIINIGVFCYLTDFKIEY